MTRYFYCIACAFFLHAFCSNQALAWEGIVVKVIDGDSLKVQRDGEIHEIRLYGIDTPEYRQPYSNKAKQFTKRLAYRKIVTLQEKDVDRYGRIVAVVMAQGKVVNRELVRKGLAWFYPRYCREQPLCKELRKLEERAKDDRRGLWRDESPVPPWDWKKKQKHSLSKKHSRWIYRLLDWL